MRASDPAGYDGMQLVVKDTPVEGRAILFTTSTAGSCTLDIETNEVNSINRNYESGTTTITKKTLTNVQFFVPANSTIVIPITAKFTLRSNTNAISYVLR